MKAIFFGALRAGRGAVYLTGLAVILAVLFGVASTAFAHAGYRGLFHLGHNNISAGVSTLTKQGPGPALRLAVKPGQRPMAVNSRARVMNLNADRLDGRSASEIGVNGLERVATTSAYNSESPKQAHADCPTGKVLVGSGYDMSGGKTGNFPNAQSNLVMDFVLPALNTDGIPTGVLVEVYENEPTSDNWNVTVYAVCATGP